MTPLPPQPDWRLPERAVTPESALWSRRRTLATLGASALALGVTAGTSGCAFDGSGTAPLAATQGPALPEAQRITTFDLGDTPTPAAAAARWNNYLEFGGDWTAWRAAQALEVRPWTLRVDGLVERPFSLDVDSLHQAMPMEERIYRLRCIQKWAFVAPWTGFPLRALIERARPLAAARYLRMESFYDPFTAPGQFKFWHPWPYHEALTLPEARHELSFLATGIYGRPLPKQHGAPLRLVVPWKYGYKSIKAIQRITFTDREPGNFWATSRPDTYGFWANVHPHVDHPYGPQTHEFLLGTAEVRPTEIFNGYGNFVADLYKGSTARRLFI